MENAIAPKKIIPTNHDRHNKKKRHNMLYSTKNGITPNHLQTHKLRDLFTVILFGLYNIALKQIEWLINWLLEFS